MAYPLTPSGTAAYNSSGKFGSSLNAGYAYSAVPASAIITTPTSFTVRGYLARTATGSNSVPIGVSGGFYFNILNGKASVNISGSPGVVVLTGTTDIFGGARHLVEFSVGAAGMLLFVDGKLEASNAGAFGGSLANPLTIGALNQSNGFPWGGDIDEVAIYSGQLNTADYTPPTTATANNAANLLALYHLDGDTTDSANAAAAAPTKVGLSVSAATGVVNSPVTVTVTTDAALTGSQTESVALTSDVAGTFNPTSVTLNAATPSATATFTPTATGAATITGTPTGTPTLANGTTSYAVTAVPSVNNALTNGTANVLWSPGNWDVQASTAKSVNAGAYFRTVITGASCQLTFDTSALLGNLPKVAYRVDEAAWVEQTIAATITLTMPTNTTEYGAKGGHLVEFWVDASTQAQSRWSPQATAAFLTGIILDAGATMAAAPALPLKIWAFSDSLGEGTRTLNLAGAASDTAQGKSRLGWAAQLAKQLNAEVGIIGFGGQGWSVAGGGSVPTFPNTYNFLYSGVARSFADAPDAVMIKHGTNDPAGTDVTAMVTSTLNGFIASLPRSTKLYVFRPYSGAKAAQIVAGIAACSDPTRILYIDTTGFANLTNGPDGIHVYGIENIKHTGPAMAAAVRPTLCPLRGARTARTVALTLVDAAGTARANLSGLRWALSDIEGVVPDQGVGATTNAAGLLSLTVFSTLAAGATAYRLWVSDTNGSAAQSPAAKAFGGPVVLS